MAGMLPKRPPLRLDPHSYKEPWLRVVVRDNWTCQVCAHEPICRVTISNCAVTRVEMRARIRSGGAQTALHNYTAAIVRIGGYKR
jgi:hypothetical protein